jgi:AcrR family transcriptional regulator
MVAVEYQVAGVESVEPSQRRRSDAVRNRERIVQAATATFRVSGLRATIPEVAAAAGVGSASVYRNFPSKADLVSAVVVSEGAEIAATVIGLSHRPSSDSGLSDAVSALFAALAANSLLADALAGDGTAAFSPVVDALLMLVDREKLHGSLSSELSHADFTLILCGTVRQLRVIDERDPERWARAAALVLKSLTP